MIPSAVKLHKSTKTFELSYPSADGSGEQTFSLPCEYLRVYSPSAEVKGHGEGQEILQVGKIHVNITDVQPVGNYALKLIFDDGHDSGIYTWEYLKELCDNQAIWWQDYLDRLNKAGESRDPEVTAVRLME
ncbi:DUF971 domain-containing protein [Sansalvadorimonas verongulae]|uniref:DUF971 domain-containing protein n=1 Tax=Sansalvadorimonas verongulae TaxID=2172824 RepID=UPI002E31D6F2|nr:DUF971 domain-containing protein [Sansalvadorimonas verongulae]MTI15488.1 DUF971 domain-containing protein [Sansalvadorimonas verongulae]